MKSKIISRKHILTFTLSFALVLAVFVNWYYTNPKGIENKSPEVTENANLGEAQFVNGNSVTTDYFQSAQVNRTKAHDSAKESLQSIINDSQTDEDTKASAKEKLLKLSDNIKLEADCENLIAAQTSTFCLVTIDFDSVEVVVPKGTINDTILIKIKDIILSKTDINGKNITIIELK